MGGCLGVLSGRLRSFPLGFRTRSVGILRRFPAVLFDALLYYVVRYRQHAIHKRRETFEFD